MKLESFFNPKSIAVVGVSDNPTKLGSVVFNNILTADFKGDLFAVNPKCDGQTLYGKPCVASVAQLPEPIDLAVILVDASKGLLVQTRRHARICALMGIKHFVFAVNKMDLIGYSRPRFEKIMRDIRVLVAEYDVRSLCIIPVSATEGDNITKKSTQMGWYRGQALLEYLEEVDVSGGAGETGFTLPVQRVCRPDRTFRGFQGTVASGRIAAGDEVTVLPSGMSSQVERILVAGEDTREAFADQAITLTLRDEVDVSRGCVIVNDAQVETSSLFTVKMLWMDDVDLLAGKNYLFKLGTKTVPGIVLEIKHKIDVNTGDHVQADRLRKNEIAECDISLSEKVVYDEFENNRVLGSMILIDRITNMTSACAVIEHKLNRSDNLTWHEMDVTRELREAHMGQKAVTLWFTGLSGSGKSTLANAVEQRLHRQGRYTMLLDGDNIRLGINKNLGFSEEDRIENIRRISEVAKLMNDAGLIVLTSFISPFLRDRRAARETIGDDAFLEIYVSTPLEECERRDVKGLYAKARRHERENFTGITQPYEEPENPDLVVDTSVEALEDSVERIVDLINRA